VRSGVNKPALRTVHLQPLFRSVFSQKKLRSSQGLRHKASFLLDMRSARIGNRQHQRVPVALLNRLLLAQSKNAGARGIGNGKIVNQVAFAIGESVKRQIVEERMRNNDQVFSLKLFP